VRRALDAVTGTVLLGFNARLAAVQRWTATGPATPAALMRRSIA